MPVRSLAKVAAVDQNIGICREALADLLELFCVAPADGALCQEARSEMQLCFIPLGNEMNRINPCTTCKYLCHLLHAIAGRIEDMHLHVGTDTVEELLVVTHAGGEKHDFLTSRRGVVSGKCIEEGLVASVELRLTRRCRIRQGIAGGHVLRRRERFSLALGEWLGGNVAERGNTRPVEHDPWFERKPGGTG